MDKNAKNRRALSRRSMLQSTGALTAAGLMGLPARLLAADPVGVAHWAGRIDDGVPHRRIAANLLRSNEYRTVRITEVFEQVLGRGPDAEELEEWRERIDVDGEFGLAAELARTSEFATRGG